MPVRLPVQHFQKGAGDVPVPARGGPQFVDILEQGVGNLGEPRLCITCRSRRIGIHRAEIALTVDQRDPHRPVLRHARERVIDRHVAVRVIIAHRIADDLGRLPVGAPRNESTFLAGPQNPPVNRLQAVAHIGKRARDDDRHGIIEIARLHLVNDVDRGNVRRVGEDCLVVAQWVSF
jgi:hypothetical protein